MLPKHSICIFNFAILSALLSISSSGCFSKNARANDPTSIREYMDQATQRTSENKRNEGSLWVANNNRSDLFRDRKARYIDDIVTIRVLESTQALATADATNDRSTQATAGFDKLFGLEGKINELPSMVSGKSDSSFKGTGSTSRETTLSTSLTARVIEVLPNGYLYVEGKREIRVNNENMSLYLTGIVRPEDINRNNVVLSSAVAQMMVKVQGRGVVSQPIKPGWLYRILNGVMPF
jgi:flagellar L-ring protein precursor FlgH